MDYTRLEEFCRTHISEKRLNHTFAVMDVACELGRRFGLSTEELRIAALFHDAMRSTSPTELLTYSEDHDLGILDIERDHPMLLHGPVAADILKSWYPEIPEQICSAIRWHTIASPEMGPEGLVLYIADYVEPNRTHLSEEQRNDILNAPTLSEMMRKILDLTIPYLQEQGHEIPQVTYDLHHLVSRQAEVSDECSE